MYDNDKKICFYYMDSKHFYHTWLGLSVAPMSFFTYMATPLLSLIHKIVYIRQFDLCIVLFSQPGFHQRNKKTGLREITCLSEKKLCSISWTMGIGLVYSSCVVWYIYCWVKRTRAASSFLAGTLTMVVEKGPMSTLNNIYMEVVLDSFIECYGSLYPIASPIYFSRIPLPLIGVMVIFQG